MPLLASEKSTGRVSSNPWGDALMQHGKQAEAIAIYQLNCEQLPESAKARAKLEDLQGK